MSTSSFFVRKDLRADRVDGADLGTQSRDVALAFTGPVAVSVTGKLSNVGDVWSLVIPGFSGTATATSAVFTATLPSWVPLPSSSASAGHPVTIAGAASAGYVQLVNTGAALTVRNFSGNFTGVCGLAGDAVLQWRSSERIGS